MQMKTALVLALMVVTGPIGDILISKGMKQVGEIRSARPAELLRAVARAVRSPYVVTGVLCLAVYFLSFTAVLTWADVSQVVPISALGFLLTTFLAQRTLGEHVTPQRWLGTLLIVAGVILVARSGGSSAGSISPGANEPTRGSSQPRLEASGEATPGDGAARVAVIEPIRFQDG
jgi:drug/metabolite transporter (DMT)-like permease